MVKIIAHFNNMRKSRILLFKYIFKIYEKNI